MEKESSTKFYGFMIGLWLDVSHIIHANEHTLYSNCILQVNVWNFWLILFHSMMKKDPF